MKMRYGKSTLMLAVALSGASCADDDASSSISSGGSAGHDGSAGSAATVGYGGRAGSGGTQPEAGIGGNAGTQPDAGAGGTAGATGGNAGTGGQGGAAGTAGQGGAGAGGAGGTAGSGATGGSAGSAGAAGTGGATVLPPSGDCWASDQGNKCSGSKPVQYVCDDSPSCSQDSDCANTNPITKCKDNPASETWAPLPKVCGCQYDWDCPGQALGSCREFVCGNAYRNGVKDAGETDVDCGGPNPVPCKTSEKCVNNEDCESNTCIFGQCTGTWVYEECDASSGYICCSA